MIAPAIGVRQGRGAARALTPRGSIWLNPAVASADSAGPTGAVSVTMLSPGEEAIAERLLDAVYSRYAGPIDRSRMPRSSPPQDRLGRPVRYFLARVQERPVGVAGFSTAGDVAEWAIEDSAGPSGVAEALLSAGEAWARQQGAREILLLKPAGARPGSDELAALGYRRIEQVRSVLMVVDFPRLLQEMAAVRRERLSALAPFTLQMHLEPGRYPFVSDPEFFIEVGPDATRAAAGLATRFDAAGESTATLFSEFLFGSRPTVDFFADGLQVTPPEAAGRARTLLTTLTFGRPWFVALGEHI